MKTYVLVRVSYNRGCFERTFFASTDLSIIYDKAASSKDKYLPIYLEKSTEYIQVAYKLSQHETTHFLVREYM